MTKEEFTTYFEALQAHDYDTFKKYYTPDYRAHFDGQTFDREGVIAVERKLAEIADSRWDILDVVADDNGFAVHAFLEMRFRTDSPPGFVPSTARQRPSSHSTPPWVGVARNSTMLR